MKRRLYFLFPDELHARHAVDTMLDEIDLDARRIHALARGEGGVARLPHPTLQQRHDTAGRAETLLWNGNLALFGIALLLFIVALFNGAAVWSVLLLALMIATFTAGFLFTSRVPRVHLDEFRDALAHGEILLMLDVPRARVREIEDYMRRRHPEAVAGGVSWSVDAFGW